PSYGRHSALHSFPTRRSSDLMYLWENSEGFRNFWIGLWEAIKTAVSWAWDNVLKPVFDAIGSLISWVINNIVAPAIARFRAALRDRKSTRLNSSHVKISYAVF